MLMAEEWIPDLYITVTTEPNTCYERIVKRGREGEFIDMEYLKKLKERQCRLHDVLRSKGVNVVPVDGEMDSARMSHEISLIITKFHTDVNREGKN